MLQNQEIPLKECFRQMFYKIDTLKNLAKIQRKIYVLEHP